MNQYDDLFAETAPESTVFANKGALDPLQEPERVRGRDEQARELATILNGFHEGYLPATVSVHGPPGTGKTLLVRRICEEFAAGTDGLDVEYINLKDCRSLFSAANELLLRLTGKKKQAYEGLDGAFEGIWDALESGAGTTILILDEIDQIRYDSHYDHNDFLYRLLRGDERLERGIDLSLILISNQLLEVDLGLDSRVRSTMSDERVRFPLYEVDQLQTILKPRLQEAFKDGALPADVLAYGIEQAAARWGDVRKTLTLFRRAGETANQDDIDVVTTDCIDRNLAGTEREEVLEQLLGLPEQHFFVLYAVATRSDGGTVEPAAVTTKAIKARYDELVAVDSRLSSRAIRDVVDALETMGLVETWVRSRDSGGREKRVVPSFDPEWAEAAYDPYLEGSDLVHPTEANAESGGS